MIYPNPTNGNITIELDKTYESATDISIINLSGSIINKDQIPSNESQITINLNTLPAGIYLIKLSNTKFTYTHRIVLTK